MRTKIRWSNSQLVLKKKTFYTSLVNKIMLHGKQGEIMHVDAMPGETLKGQCHKKFFV